MDHARAAARITFAVPYYSGVDYLRRAIDSVLRQTIADWHLLVCDDCGPEKGAEELVRSYRDERISYRRNPENLGMAGNWNRCLDLADTGLVTLLHADDELLPCYGEVMLRAADDYPEAAAFFCEAKTVGADGQDCVSLPDLFKKVLRPGRAGPLVLRGRPALEALSHGDFIMCPTVCYRKELLAGRRFRAEWRFVLDFEFFTRLLLDDLTFVGLPAVAYAYRRHAGNATTAYTASLLRFREEVALYDALARAAAARGWKRAARTASAKRVVKLHLLYCALLDCARLRPRDALRKVGMLAGLVVGSPRGRRVHGSCRGS
jgi:glycosyltransferase involved in cell wall biosynthesis